MILQVFSSYMQRCTPYMDIIYFFLSLLLLMYIQYNMDRWMDRYQP